MIESKGHKITPIDGDLAVSRNAEIGGDADIHGKARVAGSLKVEGFLDAPNIKGAVKGLFATEEELRREYSNPRPGWCAIVLADDKRGFLYLAKNREWEKQSEEAQPFDFIVDSINVFASKSEIEEAKQELGEAIKLNLDDINTETNRATEAENEIKAKALKADTVHAEVVSDSVKILGKTLDGNGMMNVLIPAATETKAGVVSAEDKKNFIKSFTWNNNTNLSNMNDFVVAGVYDIKGEHKRVDDNLPILNTGGGHSFNARLTVLDSSIERTEGEPQSDDKCITQVMSFNNRLGQGEVYIRTGKGSSLNNLTWEKWSTLQRNVYVDTVTSLDHLIDNGIYSGVYVKNAAEVETFVMVVINNYAAASQKDIPKSVSQFKYSVSLGGSFAKYETRVGGGNPVSFPYAWEILNKSEIDSMISAEIKKVTDGIDPEKIDSIKDIIAWIDEHGGDVMAIYNAITAESQRAQTMEQQLQDWMDADKQESQTADAEIRANAMQYNTLGVSVYADKAELYGRSIDGKPRTMVFPAATTERAGVMTAKDKVALDDTANEIDKIKDGDTIVAQAREIHSRNGKTVSDSFLARTTAGSGTIGDGVASLKSVGGNIVKNLVDGNWSKFAPNGTSEVSFDKGIAKVVVSVRYQGLHCPALKFVAGHKYYISCIISNKTTGSCWVQIQGVSGYGSVAAGMFSQSSQVFTATGDESVFIVITNSTSGEFYAAKPLLIDITEKFGAGNEPDQATCDKLFGTMDALPQGLTIANPTEFKSTGFNQFNPENVLEGKAIVDNAMVSGDKKIAVIPCLPCKVGTGENNGYCIHGDFGEDINVYLTPLNPKDVDGELYMHKLTKDATTDTYVPLIKGYMLVEVPTIANLCAHFLWSEDKCERDSYEPYFESKVELPTIPQMSEWGLAGIQSSGTLVCDEIDFERGVYVKRIGSVDLGNAVWSETSAEANGYVAQLVGMASQGYSHQNLICENYTTKFDNADGCIYAISSLLVVPLAKNKYPDAASFKAALQGVMLYYELAEPIEYPLPKVDNNYISSDYGVEQFNGSVPCNANNLYYMRSLAGETRNFLDRLYGNTDKTDAKEVADYITNGIESNKELATNAPNLALRALFIAAGATYNESTGYYTVGDLNDIAEEEMTKIYVGKDYINNLDKAKALAGDIKFRTMIPTMQASVGQVYTTEKTINGDELCLNNGVLEVFKLTKGQILGDVQYVSTIPYISARMNQTFNGCKKLKVIYPIHLSLVNYHNKTFTGCTNLTEVRLYGIKISVSFSDSPLISKDSIIWILKYATPTSAITITLHHDAYVRLTADQEVLNALTTKNEALTVEGKGGKISLVCATHSEEITPNA